jgi:hypothetical protein
MPFLEASYQRGAIVRRVDPDTRRNEALEHGLADYWSQELLSSTGSPIGCVDVYLDKQTSLGAAQTTLLEGVAKLAEIVIQLLVAERQFRRVIGHRQIPLLLSSMAAAVSKKPIAKGAAVA